MIRKHHDIEVVNSLNDNKATKYFVVLNDLQNTQRVIIGRPSNIARFFLFFFFYCLAFLESSNSVYFVTAKISSIEKYFKSTGNLLVQKTLSLLKKETTLNLIQLKKKAAFGSRKPSY